MGVRVNEKETIINGEKRIIKLWDVAGEMRMRLKKASDKAKITIPYPQVMMHNVQE